MVQVFITVWNFIVSHWSIVTGALTTTKLGADTLDSVKKVLPTHLETNQITQDFLDTSMTILKDQSKTVEDKKWELTTRQELMKSLVQLTAIDAAYHVASGIVLGAFSTALLNLLLRILTRRREL